MSNTLTTCNGTINALGICDTCHQPAQTTSNQCGRLVPVSNTKQKTAIQELYEKVHSNMTHTELIDWIVSNRVELHQKERQQIIDAFSEGETRRSDAGIWFNETYGSHDKE